MEKSYFSRHVAIDGLVILENKRQMKILSIKSMWIDFAKEISKTIKFSESVDIKPIPEGNFWVVSLGKPNFKGFDNNIVSKVLFRNTGFEAHVDENSVLFFTSDAETAVALKVFLEKRTKIMLQKTGIFLESM